MDHTGMFPPNKELRRDITGLRAVAVIAVTLFHVAHVLNPNSDLFQGGFLGVDIFFVISGFLMTKIIMTGLDTGDFSLYTFYKRRAKRICPALFVTIVMFVAIAILVLDNDTLLKTCRDGLRALGFISNFWFARNTGYFDGPSTERLFLHTWSLSVEWQFYLVYPLILILAYRFVSHKALGLLILALMTGSLVFGCVYTGIHPVDSYYLLPSRAYELLIGGLAYFYPLSYFIKLLKKNYVNEDLDLLKEKLSKYIEGLGLICILVSLVIVDSSKGWPNAWSIVPLLGTYLCIASDNKQTLLRNVFFQKLGLWSYAIYLVHWPLIVLIGIFSWGGVAWELLPLVLVFGIVLHYSIERRRGFGWLFLVSYFIVAASFQWIVVEKASFRNIPSVSFTAMERDQGGIPVHVGNINRPVDFILTGDSYARQYIDVLEQKDLHVISVTVGGCISTPNFYNLDLNKGSDRSLHCRDRFANFLSVIQDNPNIPVIWAQNWSGHGKVDYLNREGEQVDIDILGVIEQDLDVIAQTLSVSNNRLYILGSHRVGDSDTSNNLGKNCYALHAMNNFLSLAVRDYLDCDGIVSLDEPLPNIKLKKLISELNQKHVKDNQYLPISYIDPSKGYCNGQICRIIEEGSYRPFSHDGDHLSNHGTAPVVNYVVEQLREMEAH